MTNECPTALPSENRKTAWTIVDIYDLLPISERTLLKRMKSGTYADFRIANDRETPCDYWVSIAGVDIGVVVYYRGRKLVCHGIASKTKANQPLTASQTLAPPQSSTPPKNSDYDAPRIRSVHTYEQND